jgi:hypothetical protein
MREISRLEPAPQPLQIIDAETAGRMMPTRCFELDFEGIRRNAREEERGKSSRERELLRAVN